MDRKGEGKPGVDRPGQRSSHENGYAKRCIYTLSVLASDTNILWFIFTFSCFIVLMLSKVLKCCPDNQWLYYRPRGNLRVL
jgi:amino acid permease